MSPRQVKRLCVSASRRFACLLVSTAMLSGCVMAQPAAALPTSVQPVEELALASSDLTAWSSPVVSPTQHRQPQRLTTTLVPPRRSERGGLARTAGWDEAAPTMLLLTDEPADGASAEPPSSAAPEGPPADRKPTDVRGDPNYDRRLEATVPVFWTGIIVGGIGLGTLLGGVVAGSVYSRQLEDGYSTSMTRDEQAKLSASGSASNDAALAGAILTAIGLSMAAISGAIDWNRCGRLARKTARRRCGTLSPQ